MDDVSQDVDMKPADMSIAMEGTSKYRKVTDHGLAVPLKFPKIPCSKYTVIGHPKMRVKRDYRHGDRRKPVWKIPKAVQSSLTARFRQDSLSNKQHTAANKKTGLSDVAFKSPRFRQREGVNPIDRSSLYAAKSEDSFKYLDDTLPPRKVDLADIRFKTEKKYIDKFYRQRSSALLSPIQRKRPSRTISISLPSVVQEYDITDAKGGSHDTSRAKETRQWVMQLDRYHTRECLYCDVAGQKYCSECRRKHRFLKMKESVGSDGNVPGSTSVKLPTLPPNRIQKKQSIDSRICLSSEGQESHTEQRQRSRRILNKDWTSSALFDDPPPDLKGSRRAKAKARAKCWTLPRIDLPNTGDMTNDNDTRPL